MSPESIVIVSGAMTFGGPLVLAIRELVVLRRPPRGGDGPPGRRPLPPTPKPLPDCLRPDRLVHSRSSRRRPVRLLEDA